MNRADFELALHNAGTVADGHVTNGSIAAQLRVVDEYIANRVEDQANEVIAERGRRGAETARIADAQFKSQYLSSPVVGPTTKEPEPIDPDTLAWAPASLTPPYSGIFFVRLTNDVPDQGKRIASFNRAYRSWTDPATGAPLNVVEWVGVKGSISQPGPKRRG